MSNITVNCDDLKRYAEQLKKLQKDDMPEFLEKTTKRLASEVLRKTIERTPVGQYPELSEKVGGTLRRGWTAGESTDASGESQNISDIPVTCKNGSYKVTISNHVEYAPYVEYGHRQEPGRFVPQIGKRLKKNFVEGRFMLTKSVDEVNREAPDYIDASFKQFLEQHLGGGT